MGNTDAGIGEGQGANGACLGHARTGRRAASAPCPACRALTRPQAVERSELLPQAACVMRSEPKAEPQAETEGLGGEALRARSAKPRRPTTMADACSNLRPSLAETCPNPGPSRELSEASTNLRTTLALEPRAERAAPSNGIKFVQPCPNLRPAGDLYEPCPRDRPISAEHSANSTACITIKLH